MLQTLRVVTLIAFAVMFVSAAAPPKIVQIVITDAAFAAVPAGTTLNVGDTIEWFNKDVVDHTATAKNKAWNVDVPAGKKARLVLKAAGTFDYYCKYHPNMTGKLVIAAAK